MNKNLNEIFQSFLDDPTGAKEVKPKCNLSDDQLEALDLIKNSAYKYFFLTGKAGTGKSFVIQQLQGKIVKTATTGLAASLIGGRTLHSLLSMGIQSKYCDTGNLKKRLHDVQYVIVDEISMLEMKVFNELIRGCRTIGFQGKIVFTGDFKQLKPVQGEMCNKSKYWKQVKEMELTTLHRQSDPLFIDCLNDLRDGDYSERVRKFLESRVLRRQPEDMSMLMSRKDKAKEFNQMKIDKLQTKKEIYNMNVRVISPRIDTHQVYQTIEKQSNFSCELTLKIDSLVMVLVNNHKKGYFNGTTGFVKEMNNFSVLIETIDGEQHRIERETMTVQNGNGEVIYEYTQMPLMLAWAITIHKSQGQTINKLYIDMNNHFVEGMTYVALSRVECPSGLFISHVPQNIAGTSKLKKSKLLQKFKK